MASSVRYWAVIPAAGIGTRMQTEMPKQYLSINGKAILDYTLNRFCSHPKITGVVLVLAEHDHGWQQLENSSHAKIILAQGGVERCHSVLNGLRALTKLANPEDWVLVHDAVRPCLREQDVNCLFNELTEHTVGGLLGVPVHDTMKRVNKQSSEVCKTIERDGLWHAFTPQMFRLNVLTASLEKTLAEHLLVTDEAQAVERYGLRPMLIEGHPDNIKVTHPIDLALAELYLSRQRQK